MKQGIACCVRLALFGSFEAAGYILLLVSTERHTGENRGAWREKGKAAGEYKQQRIDRSQLSQEAQLMNLLVESISRQELEQKWQAETLN